MAEFGGEGLDQLHDRLAGLSERQAEHVRYLASQIEKRRLEARDQGMNFAAASADKILERLKGEDTPFIWATLWNYRTPLPGYLRVEAYIDNPDPILQGFMYVHFFVGPASLTADHVQALTMVDERFPRAIEPQFAGLFVDPFEDTGVRFELPLSGKIEESHYIGNLLLIQQTPFDVPGKVFDRNSIVFKVGDEG